MSFKTGKNSLPRWNVNMRTQLEPARSALTKSWELAGENAEPVALTELARARLKIRHQAGPGAVINVMSIDVEDWFQVTNFENIIDRAQWDQCLQRIPQVLPRLLDVFVEHKVRATFFTLGWIAKRYPKLIRRIHDEGHEVGSHGYDHRLVTTLSPEEFRQQLMESKSILEDIIGGPIYGYRAPSYSFRKETHWVIRELVDAGFLYDSSIFPFAGRRNPQLCVSKDPCVISEGSRALIEYPVSVAKLYGMDMPIAGGGYFRLLPYRIIQQGIKKLNQERRPAVMYFHPWEFDPAQPRVVSAPRLSRFRHYVNLEQNEAKLIQLVKEFRFASFKDLYWNEFAGAYETIAQV
jgi:polysaccharide deacetylase family protein (PEP-CTERM system associated)